MQHPPTPSPVLDSPRLSREIRLASSCLFLATLVWSGPGLAQAPDTLWTRTFGGANIDIGHHVDLTADGGHVITGYTRSFGQTSGRNVWLIKTDADGHEEWNATFGGNDDDEGHAVQQTLDGGYIIAGHTKSFGAGGKDVLLIKADAAGEAEWIRTFGGIHDDEGYAVQQTTDGGFIIAGVTSSLGAGSRDAWLIKTDADGHETWSRTHGGLSSDGAWSVQQTADGGFIFTGWTFSSGPGFLGNAWLVKTDPLGHQSWSQVFGGTGVDRGYAVRQTVDGGYILAGYTDSYGAGLYDMLLIKTDPDGDQTWLETFGGTGRDYASSVQQTNDGGFIVTGHTLSFGAGSDDVYLVKTDAQGIEQWSQTYGGSSSDVGYCVRQTPDGGYLIAGHTLSFGTGLHDVWLIRLAGDVTGVDDVAFRFRCRNHPNPFNPSTTIGYALPAPSGVKLTIYTASGREVRTLVDGFMPAGEHSVRWDGRTAAGQAAPSGVYFYRIEAGALEGTGKMVLAR